jgi:hypothetical protein
MLERTLPLKYLLRIDWLKNVAARIQAEKTVFSIPEYGIADSDEQKVIDAAKRIVNEKWSPVSIEVTFETQKTKIGTLPWVDVDIFENIIPAYPDIQLPPMLPSYPKGAHAIPPMRRCFKTGVKQCPKDVEFSPRSVVVAIPFKDEFKDVYIYAIRPTLEDLGFEVWKADENISNIDIMCKICQAIQESGFVLANISEWNANVVFEIGLAYGLGKNVVLVKQRKGAVPVDLKGLEYIEYSTLDDLKRNLTLFLKGVSSTQLAS